MGDMVDFAGAGTVAGTGAGTGTGTGAGTVAGTGTAAGDEDYWAGTKFGNLGLVVIVTGFPIVAWEGLLIQQN